MAKLFLRLTFSILFYTVFQNAFAQGSWQPGGANTSFPRTLFKASEIPAVRQSLADPERAFLYTGVYLGGYNSAPADNSTTENRRLRARAAKNAAFARIMDLKPGANGGFEPLTSAEITKLDNNALLLLNNINTQVSIFSYDQWQWRSKELIDYLIAYDLLRGAGIPVSTLDPGRLKLQEFAGNLYSASSTLAGSLYNNHLFMTEAALGMAGVVLNDMGSSTASKQPQNWINMSMYYIDNAMWRANQRQSEPGKLAGYAEGPYYFKYAMLNCLPFFRAFGNFLPAGPYSFTWNNTTRQILNPYYDPNYDLLYQWMTDITMPDGRFPALEDSYIDMGMPELAITGKPQFVKPFDGQKMETSQLNTFLEQLDGTVDMRANYLAANVTPATVTNKPLTALPNAGNLIFRSGDGFTSNYLHVYGKNGLPLTNSGGHNQGDAGSFIIYAKGQLLALDAGYLKYDRRTELGNAYNHNLVLVDGAGPAIGTTGSANDAQAYIQNTFETPGLMYGEVQTSYGGASLTRKTISIRGEYYLMADFINAAANHSYTWQLHGFGLENGTPGQGVFTSNVANHEGTWQKNGVSLNAHVTATNGASSYTKALGTHETTYDMPENHTTFLVKKDNVSQTQFLAALTPYTANPAVTTTLSLTNMAGLITTTSAFTDLVFSKADTLVQTVNTAALPQTVSSDANLTFFSVDNNQELNQAFLQNGTSLKYGTVEIIKSSRRTNLVWQQLTSGQFHGYVNKAATLQVKVPTRPESVSGDFLSSWTYNATSGIISVTFSQPSEFQYQINQAPLPVELVAFSAKKVNQQVQITWQTASEKNNQAFEIQLSTDGRNWKTLATKAGQGTTSQFTTYEYAHTPEFSGQIYYRLAQHDLDGIVSFSGIRSVLFNPESKLTVYPNPAADLFWLETENKGKEQADLVFYNAAGAVVHKQQIQLQSGANSVKITLPASFPKGIYQVQLQTTDQLRNFRLQKNQ